MGRRSSYKGPVIAAMEQAFAQEMRGPEVIDYLREKGIPESDMPPLRTVQWRQNRWRTELGEPWSSTETASPDETGYLLRVLAAAVDLTKGRRASISRAEARRALAIRVAVPQMPPTPVWRFVVDYATARQDVAHLDFSLTVAAQVTSVPNGFHLDRSQVARHVSVHVREWMDRPLVFWAGSEAGGEAYVEEMGVHASLIRRGGYHGYFIEETEWSWYNSDGFGRLIIDLRKGALD